MQSTASSSSAAHHHQNVTPGSNKNTLDNYETCNDISLMTTHLARQQQQHRKCELNSNSESDTSTNVHLRNKSKRNSNSRRCIVNRRRRKVQFNGTCLVFLVLTCLVVKLESVLGALNHNSNSINSVNYSRDNYTTLLAESDYLPFLDDTDDSSGFNETSSKSPRPQVIYQNEFAVHIFGGNETATEIAAKHGFTNLGQVRDSFFKPLWLFFITSSFFFITSKKYVPNNEI